MLKDLELRRNIAIGILFAFLGQGIGLPQAQAQDFRLPAPGVMVNLSPEFTPAYLKGIVIHPENPLKFDFIIYKGDKPLTYAQKRQEYTKLTKYFLASLAIPDDDQWVNLSPYENDRIIKDDFGKTLMGRDLLAQDYLLKQITASLIYPESKLGKEFWARVYAQAQKQYGTTNIPVNTFNKVWILPDDALIYEKGNTAYVIKNHLRVMLEEDYLSLEKHSAISRQDDRTHTIASRIIREIVLPELQKEVNEGKNFAPLRQVYSGMILAAWFKRTLKQSLLGQIYVNKAKVRGVDQDPRTNGEIYQRYLQAYKKGVFNFIKEDVGRYTNETIPRKYFSGGTVDNYPQILRVTDSATLAQREAIAGEESKDDAMSIALRENVDAKIGELIDKARADGVGLYDEDTYRKTREAWLRGLKENILNAVNSKLSELRYVGFEPESLADEHLFRGPDGSYWLHLHYWSYVPGYRFVLGMNYRLMLDKQGKITGLKDPMVEQTDGEFRIWEYVELKHLFSDKKIEKWFIDRARSVLSPRVKSIIEAFIAESRDLDWNGKDSVFRFQRLYYAVYPQDLSGKTAITPAVHDLNTRFFNIGNSAGNVQTKFVIGEKTGIVYEVPSDAAMTGATRGVRRIELIVRQSNLREDLEFLILNWKRVYEGFKDANTKRLWMRQVKALNEANKKIFSFVWDKIIDGKDYLWVDRGRGRGSLAEEILKDIYSRKDFKPSTLSYEMIRRFYEPRDIPRINIAYEIMCRNAEYTRLPILADSFYHIFYFLDYTPLSKRGPEYGLAYTNAHLYTDKQFMQKRLEIMDRVLREEGTSFDEWIGSLMRSTMEAKPDETAEERNYRMQVGMVLVGLAIIDPRYIDEFKEYILKNLDDILNTWHLQGTEGRSWIPAYLEGKDEGLLPFIQLYRKFGSLPAGELYSAFEREMEGAVTGNDAKFRAALEKLLGNYRAGGNVELTKLKVGDIVKITLVDGNSPVYGVVMDVITHKSIAISEFNLAKQDFILDRRQHDQGIILYMKQKRILSIQLLHKPQEVALPNTLAERVLQETIGKSLNIHLKVKRGDRFDIVWEKGEFYLTVPEGRLSPATIAQMFQYALPIDNFHKNILRHLIVSALKKNKIPYDAAMAGGKQEDKAMTVREGETIVQIASAGGVKLLRRRVKNPKARVLIIEPIDRMAIDELWERKDIDYDVLHPDSEISEGTDGYVPLGKQQLIEVLKKAQADPRGYAYIVPFVNLTIDKEVMDAAPELRGITSFGTGYNNIDIAQAKARGIVVTNAPGPLTTAMAEFNVGLALEAKYRIPEALYTVIDRRESQSLTSIHLNLERDGQDREALVQLIWGQLLRQSLKYDDMFKLVKEKKFCKCGIGPQATVLHDQLGKDLSIGINTSLGIVAGKDRYLLDRLVNLATAFEIGKINIYVDSRFSQEQRGDLKRQNPNITFVSATTAQVSDYVIVTPDALPSVLPFRKNVIVDTRSLGIKPGFKDILTSSLWGKTFAVAGLGGIGEPTAKRMVALGMKVAFSGTQEEASYESRTNKLKDQYNALRRQYEVHEVENPVEKVEKSELFRRANVLMPLMKYVEKENKNYVDAESLGRAQDPNVIIVNSSRGAVVNEADLMLFMKEHPRAQARLDVLVDETKNTFKGLNELSNVKVTGHTGSAVPRIRLAMQRIAIKDNLLPLIDGGAPDNLVPELKSAAVRDAAMLGIFLPGKVIFHSTLIGAVRLMVKSKGRLDAGSLFADQLQDAVGQARRFKGEPEDKTENITLSFSIDRLRERSIKFHPFFPINWYLESIDPVPLAVLTDESKREVVQSLLHLSTLGHEWEIDPHAIATALGFESWDGMEKQLFPDGAATAEPQIGKDAAMKSPGGIDMNSANLNMQIKRDGHGVPLPLAQQDLAQISDIDGLVPVIISIKPASQTALFFQLVALS